MNMLTSNEVIETSATDLIGQYIGQTGPKTQAVLERGLGKVLFIDEAYRLADGHFAKEAMDELVDCLTKPKFFQRMIIILAGYDADINRLMSINTGMTSRFPESLQFDPLSSQDCISLLLQRLLKMKNDMSPISSVVFDINCLQSPDAGFEKEMTQHFETLSRTASWANARDIETLAKSIFGKTLRSISMENGNKLLLTREAVIEQLISMIDERRKREDHSNQSLINPNGGQILPLRPRALDQPPPQLDSQDSMQTNQKTGTKTKVLINSDTENQASLSERDADVTDEVWNQLEKDKAAAKATEEEYERSRSDLKEQEKRITMLKEEEENVKRKLEKAKIEADEQSRREHEQARLRHEMKRREEEEVARELERKRQIMEEARRKEQANQMKLKTMGVCVMGYRWIKQSGGYRCAGGSHWVSDAQLQ